MAARRRGMQKIEFIFPSPSCHFRLWSQNPAPDQRLDQRGTGVLHRHWAAEIRNGESWDRALKCSRCLQMCVGLAILGVGGHFSLIESSPGFTDWESGFLFLKDLKPQSKSSGLVSALNTADGVIPLVPCYPAVLPSGHLLRVQKTWIQLLLLLCHVNL